MADLTGLNLRKLDETNWDTYPPGGGVRKPPQEPGRYEARSQDIADIKFDSKDGYLRFMLRGTILDGDPEKDDTVFDFVSVKPYSRGKRAGASRMGDYLMAVGSDARPGADPEQWADAVLDAAGGVFRFILDWDAYDKDSETQFAETASDFPDDPNHPGERLPYVEVKLIEGRMQVVPPGTQGSRRVPARQRVRFYVFEKESD